MARRRDLQLLRLAVIAIAIATNVRADIRALHPGHPAIHGPVHYLTALDGLLLSLIDPTSWRGFSRRPSARSWIPAAGTEFPRDLNKIISLRRDGEEEWIARSDLRDHEPITKPISR